MTARPAASPTPSRPLFRAADEVPAAAEDAGPRPAVAAWSAHGAGIVVTPAVAGRVAGADRPARLLEARTVRSAAVGDRESRAVPLHAEPLLGRIGIVWRPGGGGAVALLAYGGDRRPTRCDVLDLPLLRPGADPSAPVHRGRRAPELDLARLAALLGAAVAPAAALVERARPPAERDAARIFASGRAHGAVLGVLAGLGIPARVVSRAAWRRDLGLGGPGGDAEAIRARAAALFPARAGRWRRGRDIARAEAALLAEWGRRAPLRP